MTIRKTCQWCALIVLLLAVGAGGYVYSLWKRSDELLRRGILEKLAEVAPGWHIEIERARFDWARRIHVHNVSLHAHGGDRPLAKLPEVIVTVDRDQLTRDQQVIVHKIVLLGAEINLLRGPDGRWNWQDLPPLPANDKSLPEVELRQGALRLFLEPPDAPPVSKLVSHQAYLQFIPSGKRQYVLSGRTEIEQAGKLALQGNWNIDAKTWSLDGRLHDVLVADDLLNLVAAAFPSFQHHLSRVDEALRAGRATDDALLPTPHSGNLAHERSPKADLRVAARLDVQFRIARPEPERQPNFKIRAEVLQGQCTHPAFPFPLHDLAGVVYCDNTQMVLQNLEAKNGITRISLDANVSLSAKPTAGSVRLRAFDLVLDRRLQSRLPLRWKKLYDPLAPSGHVDVELALESRGGGPWHQRDFHLTAKHCTFAHEAFPYRITDVNGTMDQNERNLLFQFDASAGPRPLTIDGITKNIGPAAETTIDVRITRLPLNETFVAACPPAVQRTIAALRLRASADMHVRLYRPPQENRRFQWSLQANVHDGSLQFVDFPYRVNQLGGLVTYSSRDQIWHFRDVTGAHDSARLEAVGSFARTGQRGLLELTVAIQNAALDEQLRRALRMTEAQVALDQLSPTGKLNATTEIRWETGQRAQIVLPQAELLDGSIVLKALPYPLNAVRARFAYADNQVDVASFSGRHDQATVRARGRVRATQTGWETHISDFHADNLIADRQFRLALPPDLRTVVEELDPRGPLDLSGSLYLRGTAVAADPVTAAWDLKTVFSGNTVSVGVELNDLHGSVTARGTLDHRSAVQMQGQVNFESVSVWGYQFTQVNGPFEMAGGRLTVGSPASLFASPEGGDRRRVPLEQRITGRAVGGVLTLDATALLEEHTSYRVLLTMSNGDMEQYARRYSPGTTSLRGIINGWIDLRGSGPSADEITGRGQLQISPAALYELPVVAQIFKVLSFVPPDKTAFTYALADFDLRSGRFWFNTIDLIGDAISLRGRGNARFVPADGRLDLDFYATAPRNQFAAIPFVNLFANEASKALVGIEVTGTVGAPDAKIKPVPQLNDAMRQFLSVLDGRQPGRVPRLLISPTGPPRHPSSLRPRSNRR